MRIPALMLILLLRVKSAAAIKEPETCYILDAILFVYGVILTALYCHLKMETKKKKSEKAELYEHLRNPEIQIYSEIGKGTEDLESRKGVGEGVYTDLDPMDKGKY